MSEFLNKTRIEADYYVITTILRDIWGDLMGNNPTGTRTITSAELKEKLLVCLDVCKDIIKREESL